jgi:hypothetical protein
MASEVIDRARASYRERAWAAAYADFHAADDESPLAIDDLEQLAVTAYLIGKDDDSLEIPCRVHGRSSRDGRLPVCPRRADTPDVRIHLPARHPRTSAT